MAENSDQVVVGSDGQMWVAPYANVITPPTNATTDPNTVDPDFANLGFLSEDGATFGETKDITDIGAWQSFYELRKIVTARHVMVNFVLRQWNQDTIELALGGTVTGAAGAWVFDPFDPSVLDIRALILDWQDGTKSYRLWIPKGIVTGGVETQLVRTAASDLPIEFSAVDPGSGLKIYRIFTNDNAFGPTGS